MSEYSAHWPNPLELQDLKDAVDERRTEATLGDREFTIRYEEDRFWVQVKDDFIPCGWFDYKSTFAEIE